MKFSLWPKSSLGKWSSILGLGFIVLMAIKIIWWLPVPSFGLAAIGLGGLVIGIVAAFKKELSVFTILAMLAGLVILLWIIGELIYPH